MQMFYSFFTNTVRKELLTGLKATMSQSQ